MKKTALILTLIMGLLAVLCCGCGKKEGKTPDTAAVADAIEKSGSFDELIDLTDDNIARRYYGLDLDAVDSYTVRVCSSGALADEIAVFKMKKHQDVEDMLEVLKERKQELYDSFVDYVPSETDKINNAIIGSNGNYVYLIVCTDRSSAKTAAENCF